MDLTPGFKRPFKGNPQQGTLFRASAQELDPTGQRYPRGYTPERQREVWDAVGEVGYSSQGERMGATDAEFPMLLNEEEFGFSDDASKRNWGEGRAVIRDSIARSTVPMDVVERVNFGVTPNVSANAFYGPREDTIYFGRSADEAQQHREGFGTGYPTPETQRHDQGQTVIHELGHAADPALEPLRGRRNLIREDEMGQPLEGYTEPDDIGLVEQVADDFTAEHFRHDPRVGRKRTFEIETGMYPGANPSDIPPRGRESYTKWNERSRVAIDDMRPRWREAEAAGGTYPTTQEQRTMATRVAAEEETRQPRLL